MAQRRANSPTPRNFRQTRRRTTANPSTDDTAAGHFDLFRASVRRGGEGDCRLGVDHSLFLTRCPCRCGSRPRAYGRTDQSALSTTDHSADECARCGATTYFGHVAPGMAFAFSTKAAG